MLRYIGIAVALVYALFPIVFIVSSAFNPGGTLTTTSLIPKGASLVNFTRPLRACGPTGAGTRTRSSSPASATVASVLHRRAGRVRVLPAAVPGPPSRSAGPAAGPDVPRAARPSWRCSRSSTRSATSSRSWASTPRAGLILAYLGGAMGANVWLLKGYFDTVPREIDEAAIVDGASHARIFFTMHLRLITPILITVGMIAFVGLFKRVPARQHLPQGRRQPDPGRRPLRAERGGQEQVLRPVLRRRAARLHPHRPHLPGRPEAADRRNDRRIGQVTQGPDHSATLLSTPHHDGSALYVSELAPGLGDVVSVWLRVPADVPVDGRPRPHGRRRRAGVRPGHRRRQALRRHRHVVAGPACAATTR